MTGLSEVERRALQGQVRLLVDDLRGQVAVDDKLRADLLAEWREATGERRTGAAFEA